MFRGVTVKCFLDLWCTQTLSPGLPFYPTCLPIATFARENIRKPSEVSTAASGDSPRCSGAEAIHLETVEASLRARQEHRASGGLDYVGWFSGKLTEVKQLA